MDPMQYYQLMQMMRQQQGAGQLPSYGAPQQQGQGGGHGGGFNPLMMLSPIGGLMMSNPKLGMFGLSPALGLANMLGAFK